MEHQRVHTGRVEHRGRSLKLYEFSVWSDRLMLAGKCDCLEAYECSSGTTLPAEKGFYELYPIEYKHGRVRKEIEYELQLCAQAMCLEEMYHTKINEGALFYIDAHQRVEVPLSPELRELTVLTSEALWNCFKNRALPAASEGPKCRKCSLKDDCMPALERSAQNYCRSLFKELQEEKL